MESSKKRLNNSNISKKDPKKILFKRNQNPTNSISSRNYLNQRKNNPQIGDTYIKTKEKEINNTENKKSIKRSITNNAFNFKMHNINLHNKNLTNKNTIIKEDKNKLNELNNDQCSQSMNNHSIKYYKNTSIISSSLNKYHQINKSEILYDSYLLQNKENIINYILSLKEDLYAKTFESYIQISEKYINNSTTKKLKSKFYSFLRDLYGILENINSIKENYNKIIEEYKNTKKKDFDYIERMKIRERKRNSTDYKRLTKENILKTGVKKLNKSFHYYDDKKYFDIITEEKEENNSKLVNFHQDIKIEKIELNKNNILKEEEESKREALKEDKRKNYSWINKHNKMNSHNEDAENLLKDNFDEKEELIKNNDYYEPKEKFEKINEKFQIKEDHEKLKEENEIFKKYKKNKGIECQNIEINKKIDSSYIFLMNNLYKIGSNNFMNSIIQCLLHINELIYYFLNIYPNIFPSLKKKNINIPTKGEISELFYNIINDESKKNKNYENDKFFNKKNPLNKNKKQINLLLIDNFQKNISFYKPQFNNYDYNYPKDMILFLLHSLNEELNYFGNNTSENKNYRNLLDKFYMRNSSIISKLFYGILEETIKCNSCQTIKNNFQKFELITFNTNYYRKKIFSISNGLEDMVRPKKIKNSICDICENKNDCEYCCKIIEPPNKLLIYIDYNEDSQLRPSKIKISESIDISKYVNYNFGLPIEYELICICTYNATCNNNNCTTFCKNREKNKWYKFNCSSSCECKKDDIYSGNQYLLLYDKI